MPVRKISFDGFCRGLFIILLKIWVVIYIYKIFQYPSQTSIIITLFILIIGFSFFSGFFEILESFAIKVAGFEFQGKVKRKKKQETEVLFKQITPYHISPSDEELDISTKDIDQETLSTMNGIYNLVKEEEE